MTEWLHLDASSLLVHTRVGTFSLTFDGIRLMMLGRAVLKSCHASLHVGNHDSFSLLLLGNPKALSVLLPGILVAPLPLVPMRT